MCGGSAGVRWCLACPSSLLDPPCGAACAVLLRAGCSRPWGRVGVPPILGHAGGGVHFPGPSGTRSGRVFGVWLRWFWADLSDQWHHIPHRIEMKRFRYARSSIYAANPLHNRSANRIICAHLSGEGAAPNLLQRRIRRSPIPAKCLVRLTTRTNALVDLLCQINQLLGISSTPSVSNRPLSHLLRRKNDPLIM